MGGLNELGGANLSVHGRWRCAVHGEHVDRERRCRDDASIRRLRSRGCGDRLVSHAHRVSREAAMVTDVVRIDRAKWRTGRWSREDARYGKPKLLSHEKYGSMRCCLGYLGKACGIADGVLLGMEIPSHLYTVEQSKFPKVLFGDLTPFYDGESMLVAVNDAEDVPDDVREDWISTGFRIVLDRTVVFHGEYPPL